MDERSDATHPCNKIGNLVIYTLKGKNVVPTIGVVTKAPTPAQPAN